MRKCGAGFASAGRQRLAFVEDAAGGGGIGKGTALVEVEADDEGVSAPAPTSITMRATSFRTAGTVAADDVDSKPSLQVFGRESFPPYSPPRADKTNTVWLFRHRLDDRTPKTAECAHA